MAGKLPPLFPISDEDHSGYVAVTVYTLLSLTVATVLVRLFTRWYIARVIYTDDILLASATVCSSQLPPASYCRRLMATSITGIRHPPERFCSTGHRPWTRQEDKRRFEQDLTFLR
jgi:hypothetical protein